MISVEEKYCPRCNETLPSSDFTKSSGRYDGLQSYCSVCMKKYRIEHYNRNKQAHLDRNKKTQAKLIQYVLDYKEETSCTDCGILYPGEPWLLQFDHLNADTKVLCVSTIIGHGSIKKLIEEMNKCELVCVVCHTRRTARRANYKTNRLSHLL